MDNLDITIRGDQHVSVVLKCLDQERLRTAFYKLYNFGIIHIPREYEKDDDDLGNTIVIENVNREKMMRGCLSLAKNMLLDHDVELFFQDRYRFHQKVCFRAAKILRGWWED